MCSYILPFPSDIFHQYCLSNLEANMANQTHWIESCAVLYYTNQLWSATSQTPPRTWLYCHSLHRKLSGNFSFGKTSHGSYKQKKRRNGIFHIWSFRPIMRHFSPPPLFQESVLCFLPLFSKCYFPKCHSFFFTFYYVPLRSAYFIWVRHIRAVIREEICPVGLIQTMI